MNRAAKWRGKEEKMEDVFHPTRAIRKLFGAGPPAIKVRNPKYPDLLGGKGAFKSLSLFGKIFPETSVLHSAYKAKKL